MFKVVLENRRFLVNSFEEGETFYKKYCFNNMYVKNLPKSIVRFAKDNPLLKYVSDDARLLEFLVKDLIVEKYNPKLSKVYYIASIDEIAVHNYLDQYLRVIKWSCTRCGDKILIDYSLNVKPKALICEPCWWKTRFDRQNIKKIKVEYMKFSKHVYDRLLKEDKLIKKNVNRIRKSFIENAQ